VTPAVSPTAGSSIARGAAWMVLFKVLDRSIGLVSTLVLARLLTPADFGLVAMATAVVALIELMSAFGFDVALIQRRDVTRAHYDTAWTFNVLFGVAIALLLLLLAWPAAAFYREPRLTLILPVLAFASLVQGCENVGTVAFRKEMDFRREFRFLAVKRVVAFAATMTLAFTLRNYWALVGGIVLGKVLGVVVSYVVHPYRPRLSLASRRDLMGFSQWLFANNLVNFLNNRGSDFILGRTLGAGPLGIFSLAYEVATMPSTELVAPLNRAALPGYARVAHDAARTRETFLSVVGMIVLLVFPVGAGLAAVASPAVRLLLGPQWLAAIPLIQVLAVCGAISALQSNLVQVLLALGRSRVITFITATIVAVLLPGLWLVSSLYGLAGVAWLYLGCTLAAIPLVHAVFFRIACLPVADYLRRLWRPLVAAIVMGIAVTQLRAALVAFDPAVGAAIELVAGVATGVVLYPVVLILLWLAAGRPAGTEATVLRTLRARLAR